jgi:hypothetical protein
MVNPLLHCKDIIGNNVLSATILRRLDHQNGERIHNCGIKVENLVSQSLRTGLVSQHKISSLDNSFLD